MIMNIAWLTVRKWDDFCSTTTDALAHGLIERGHLLTVFNGDASEHHASKPWSHISLEQSSFPGRSGASLARSAVLWFQENLKNPMMQLLWIGLLRPELLVSSRSKAIASC